MEPNAPPMDTGEARDAFERRFRRAGLPVFIERRTASRDIFTRAFPLLAVVFVGLVLDALNLRWGFWANVGALTGGLVLTVTAFGVLNVVQRRRFLSRPARIGGPELVAFVLVPSALPLVFGGQVISAVVTAGGLVLLLVVIYLVVGFGLPSILRWAAARLFGAMASSLRTLVRAIPLLLFFSLLLFLTQETWQVLAAAPRVYVGATAGLVMGLGALFVVARVPREVGRLEQDAAVEGPALSTAERANVGLVLFVSQSLQILLVGIGIGAFFTAFGALTVSPHVLSEWIGATGHPVLRFGFLGHEVVLTQELLRVAGAIGGFSGLYYAITALTDPNYREEFLGDITVELRSVFEARAEYRRLIEASEMVRGGEAGRSPAHYGAGSASAGDGDT